MPEKVFVVSDGTGRTAEQALNAALTQFPAAVLEIVRRPRVRSVRKVRETVAEAAASGGFIVHTLVTDQLRALMVRLGRQRHVETIDLMGPLLARLSNRLARTPTERPGLFSELNRDYFRRIETMEFAIRHDDGARPHELRRAEIVLVGVSRTFKTPLSIYLAFQGWFVANVPIVSGIPIPPQVFRLPRGKVFCLDTSARQLASLRRSRYEYLNRHVDDYADLEVIRMELMEARRMFHKSGFRIVDVTNKPIEEIASEILAVRTGTSAGGRPAGRRRV